MDKIQSIFKFQPLILFPTPNMTRPCSTQSESHWPEVSATAGSLLEM